MQSAAAPSTPPDPGIRASRIQHALRLEYFTVGWNILEGIVALVAASAAGSVALFAFGVDSFVETSSGLILIWRLTAETRLAPHDVEALDRRARKLVAISLFALAAYVAYDAVSTLVVRSRPQPTVVGIALTAVSLAVMRWLARAKVSAARALGSRAMESDAFQTSACWWLSAIALAGIGVNSALGWWWADPVAALSMIAFIVREGREAWRGETCGCG